MSKIFQCKRGGGGNSSNVFFLLHWLFAVCNFCQSNYLVCVIILSLVSPSSFERVCLFIFPHADSSHCESADYTESIIMSTHRNLSVIIGLHKMEYTAVYIIDYQINEQMDMIKYIETDGRKSLIQSLLKQHGL